MEELFPEHSHYRASALRSWEKKLRPVPNKAAKADSGRVPLPPVLKKQKERSRVEQEAKTPSLPRPISRDEEKSLINLTPSDVERCYEIGRVIGDGNFAEVRECRRRHDDQILAVKIVERSKLTGREHMMQNELSLLGSLCHPRVVQLLAHHHTQTHSYLVMELVGGGDLFEAISDRGRFSEAEAGLMVLDVSDALSYIHSKSIVHRDLKPENLLIEKVTAGVCRLKLGDFGLAMVVTEPVFTICGTPTYVAPEILRETGYGVAVDVWALGVILYILLSTFSSSKPRHSDSVSPQQHKHSSRPPSSELNQPFMLRSVSRHELNLVIR
uniref:Doublecortin-like kinase 3 n=1 Tax=Nothobranchius furzeri TaxID=105023 RepID=A0A8C6PPT5_NOTFU